MATFGSQVNPSLGAINYTPFLQGSMVGSQAMGQGIAAIGQGIGEGIKQYKEAQKQNKEKEAVVKAGLKSLESLAQLPGIDKNVVTAISPLIQIANDPNASLVQKEAAIKNGIQQFNMVMGIGQQTIAQKQREQELKLARDRMITERIATMQSALKQERPDKVIDPVAIRSTGPAGEPIEISVDRMTGQEISRGPVSQPKYVRTPQEEAEATALVESAKRDVAFLETVPSMAIDAASIQASSSEVRDLLKMPETQAGAGQNYITALRGYAKRAGFADADLANQQKLESLLGEDALRQTQNFMKGQGAVSNAERDRIDKLSLNIQKDKKAIIELLDYRDALAARSVGAEQERQRLFDEGKSPREQAESLRRWYSKNTVSKFLKDVKQAQEFDYAPALQIITGGK